MRIVFFITLLCFATFEILLSITFEKIELHPNIDNAVVKMIRPGDDYIDFYLVTTLYRSDKSLNVYYANNSKTMFGEDFFINSADYINGEIIIGSNGLYFFEKALNLKENTHKKKINCGALVFVVLYIMKTETTILVSNVMIT